MGVQYSDDCMHVKHNWGIFTLRDCTGQLTPYGSV